MPPPRSIPIFTRDTAAVLAVLVVWLFVVPVFA